MRDLCAEAMPNAFEELEGGQHITNTGRGTLDVGESGGWEGTTPSIHSGQEKPSNGVNQG